MYCIMVSMSLSPLPLRPIITISLEFSLGARFSRWASAWAGSSAGIIPSSLEVNARAFRASSSVAATYSALSKSFKKLCSGPTPG